MGTLFLASTSPRRRELLAQIGVPFSPLNVSIDESLLPGEPAEAYVRRLAQEKARAGFAGLDDASACVLGADTSVVLGDQVLGKPQDRKEGMEMLAALSGRGHKVMTAVALCSEKACEVRLVVSEVHFRLIDEAEAAAYWDSGEPRDKAGGYGIQGWGAVFVSHLQGSYSAVVGLPLCETAQLLDAFGLKRWCSSAS